MFVTSNVAKFLTNLTLSIHVLLVLLSNIFTVTNPNISSMNGNSLLINFCSNSFNIAFSFEKMVLTYLTL